jgi:hypothetical protein
MKFVVYFDMNEIHPTILYYLVIELLYIMYVIVKRYVMSVIRLPYSIAPIETRCILHPRWGEIFNCCNKARVVLQEKKGLDLKNKKIILKKTNLHEKEILE